MTRTIIIFLLSLTVTSFESNGQEKPFDQAAADSERIAFTNTLDSLFLKNQYERIKEICGPSPAVYSICNYNLIGAYYFTGDSLKSWELLNRLIAAHNDGDADAYTMGILLSKDYAAYKKFLINSTAKSYILGKIDSFYMTEPVSDKGNGLTLMHLLIEDQWVRNTSSLYDHFKPERKFLLPSKMDSAEAIQAQLDHCTKVFNFYKSKNKVFSEAEVGWIYHQQSLLFFHEWNLKRRAFYHELIRKGVKNGALEPAFQANFEAGTLFIKMGSDEFFKHRSAIQEDLKKKYALPADYRIMLI